jgi:hypothetical protein
VFTKLHALGLVEYDKILMLDIDIAVLDCADALFDLPAPAALWRGLSQTREHGFPIDGRCFFGGPDDNWGQTGGINAGVMMLAPDSSLHTRALQEVQAPMHPERIPGAGPEQDYLSRFFAPYWTHLSVLYNFQLHHIFFSLEAAIETATDMPLQPPANNKDVILDDEARERLQRNPDTDDEERNVGVAMHRTDSNVGHADAKASELSTWLPGRLSLPLSDIKIVHFSGEVKMWHRDYLAEETDERFVDRFLRNNNAHFARLWLDLAGSDDDYAPFGVRCENGRFVIVKNEQPAAAIAGIIDKAIPTSSGGFFYGIPSWLWP